MALPASIAAQLRSILGPEGFLDAPEDLRAFAYDLFANHQPDAVALPADVEQVSAVMRLCNQNKIPVYPRGSGTSLAGSPVPVLGGLVLCSSRMNKVLEVSVTDRLARVQSGCVTGDLQKAAAAQGLMEAREGGEYISCDDLQQRSGVNKAVIESLRQLGVLAGLPETSQMSLFGF